MSLPQRAWIVLAVAAVAPHASPAGAHIQVRPAQAAPGDPVLWTVLVPSEQQAGTRQVELAVPADVLPFSYEEVAGWKRTLRMNGDGSVRSIVWRGRTSSDGLATFRFLASTPERDGQLAWKAIQTYRDGEIVRWIGSPASETPASVTRVSSAVARENAGGEGGDGAAASPATTGRSDADAASASRADDAVRPDWVARGLGLTALLAAASVAISLRRRAST